MVADEAGAALPVLPEYHLLYPISNVALPVGPDTLNALKLRRRVEGALVASDIDTEAFDSASYAWQCSHLSVDGYLSMCCHCYRFGTMVIVDLALDHGDGFLFKKVASAFTTALGTQAYSREQFCATPVLGSSPEPLSSKPSNDPWREDMHVAARRSTQWLLNDLRASRIEARIEGLQSLARLARSTVFMGHLFALEPAGTTVVRAALTSLRDPSVAIRRHAVVAVATLTLHPGAVSCMLESDPRTDLENLRGNHDEPIGTRRWATMALRSIESWQPYRVNHTGHVKI